MASVITRGTTPTLVWHIPENSIDFETIDNVHAIFYSLNKTITKDMADIELDADTRYIMVYLTQEETLGFDVANVSAQLRIHLSTGQALATTIKMVTINPILEEKVIDTYE